MKIQEKKYGWGREGGRGRVWGVRVDVIEELKSFWEYSQKKFRVGVGFFLGGRVDVNEELKFLCKFKKKIFFFWGGFRGGGSGLGSQDGCKRRIEVFVKFQKKKKKNGGWGGGGPGGRVGGGCEQRIEVFVKIKKKMGGRGAGSGCGGQGGCERRIEVFVKIQKKKKIRWGREVGGVGFVGSIFFFFFGGGGGFQGEGGRVWGVRMDVNEELKFL